MKKLNLPFVALLLICFISACKVDPIDFSGYVKPGTDTSAAGGGNGRSVGDAEY